MRRMLFGALVLALSTTTPTHAQQPTLAGDVCDYQLSLADAEGEDWTAVVTGGPIAAASLPTMVPAVDELLDDNVYSVTLTCSLKVGWSTDHTTPAAGSATAYGLAVAVLPPTTMAYDDPDFTGIGICTEVTVTDRDGDSATLYWDVYDEAFGTDPSASCGPVYCPTSSDDACGGGGAQIPPQPVQDVVDIANQVFVEHVDPPLCAVLGGDVPDVWDCPPYQN